MERQHYLGWMGKEISRETTEPLLVLLVLATLFIGLFELQDIFGG
jgi:hypothetical protein